MSRFLRLLLLVALLAGSVTSSSVAQTATSGTVRGTVQTDEGMTLPGATVAVRAPSDSALVGGTTTGVDGTFSVSDLALRDYDVVVRFVGYEVERRRVSLTAAALDLGRIEMTPSTSQMDELEVAAHRPALRMDGSTRVYSFSEMQTALATKSTADLLQSLSSVNVDEMRGGLTLRGSGAVALHVNGRPVSFEGQSLIQYLMSLPAENVERVEVQTNPSAKYDASGTAGIINVVMKKTEDRGWSGGVSGRGGTLATASGSGYLGFRSGGWTLRGEYGASRRDHDFDQDVQRRRVGTSTDVLLDQEAANHSTRGGHRFNVQAEYAFTPQTTLSLTSSGHSNDRTSDQSVTYHGGFAGNDVRSVGTTARHVHVTEQLRLDHAFGTGKNAPSLTADVNVEWYQNDDGFAETRAVAGTPRRHEEEDHRMRSGTLQIDFTRPSDTWTVETGGRSEVRDLRQDVGTFVWDSAADGFAPTGQRGLDLRDAVHAGYVITKRTVGDVSLEAGVRGEVARVDVAQLNAADVRRTYASLFPSASVTYRPSKKQSLGLSYTKRVNRPATYQLSFGGINDDPYVQRRGNPNLSPEYIHKTELTYLRHVGPATITVSPYGQYVANEINWRSVIVNDTLTVRTFDNYASSTSLGAEVSTSWSIGKSVKAQASTNLFHRDTNGAALDGTAGAQSMVFTARVNATWTVRPGLRLQASQFYRAPREQADGTRMTAYYRTEISAQQSFWSNRASLGLRVEDPFNTSTTEFWQQNEQYREYTLNDWSGRQVSLSFSYKWGKQQKSRRR